MFHFLDNLRLLVPIVFRLAYGILYKNKRKNVPYLYNIAEGLTLPDKYRQRFEVYGKMSCFIHEWFMALKGKDMEENEYKSLVLFCALTALVDDLIDDHDYDYNDFERLKRLESNINMPLETLCIRYFKEIEKQSGGRLFNVYLDKVIDYQILSKKQINGKLENALLREITYNKGGYATLLCRSIFSYDVVKGEHDVVFSLGVILQLENDIFDIYKDIQANIQTLPNSTDDITTIKQAFLDIKGDIIKQILNLAYPIKNKQRFILIFNLLASRGIVALNQLYELQKNSNDKFTPHLYSRKQLICDMEKLDNIWFTLLHSLNFNVKSHLL